jgi:hypothetical protein
LASLKIASCSSCAPFLRVAVRSMTTLFAAPDSHAIYRAFRGRGSGGGGLRVMGVVVLGRCLREGGRGRAEPFGAHQVSDESDGGEGEPHPLREPGRPGVLCLRGRPEPGSYDGGEQQRVGRVADPRQDADREHHGLESQDPGLGEGECGGQDEGGQGSGEALSARIDLHD